LKWDCPHGVIQGFQITSHKSDPRRRVRRLLSKDDWRAALADERLEYGPEMAGVGEPELESSAGDSLAREGRSPNRSIVSPSDAAQRERPAADSCEEVRGHISLDVVRTHVANVASIDVAGRQSSNCDESLKPAGRVFVMLIIVNPLHALTPQT
jgi:hypothetical protein